VTGGLVCLGIFLGYMGMLSAPTTVPNTNVYRTVLLYNIITRQEYIPSPSQVFTISAINMSRHGHPNTNEICCFEDDMYQLRMMPEQAADEKY
jgi:hypothetical protein